MNALSCLSRGFIILLVSAGGILNAAGAPAKSSFNVRDYGAVGDGKHLDSSAINKALAAAGSVGGGTVLVPAGTYLSGSIHLQSNIHLLIDAGATILGAPQNLNAYDETEAYNLGGYQDGGHCFYRRAWHDQWRRFGER